MEHNMTYHNTVNPEILSSVLVDIGFVVGRSPPVVQN